MAFSDDLDEQDRRIIEIAGEDADLGSERWLVHLRATLSLPCEVTGSEDFRWEEPYVDESTPNRQLLEDYSSWIVNFG